MEYSARLHYAGNYLHNATEVNKTSPLNNVQEKETPMSFPQISSRDTWLQARRALLVREKQMSRASAALAADRRRLPMVHVEEDYRLTGLHGEVGLVDLFDGHRQLIVQHFMFDPSWDEGCPSCTGMAAELNDGIRDHLARRSTAFAAVSRAPLEKINAYREAKGWTFPWYSSNGSMFNYDFHVTLDPEVAATEYNFRTTDELVDAGLGWMTVHVGEQPGISSFLRDGDEIFHTYSTYGRGVDVMMSAYRMLDITALGRQEDWEEPQGRAPKAVPGDPGYTERVG